MANPRPMDLHLKTHPRAFPDPTFELTRNPVEGTGPDPVQDLAVVQTPLLPASQEQPGNPATCHADDRSDLWLNEPEDVLKKHPRSVKYTRPTYHDLAMYTSRGTPQDSCRSSGPATSVMDERARSTTNKPLTAEASMDQEILHQQNLTAEQGPSAVADICLINMSLYHLVYILDIESSSFTDTIIQVSHMGQPTVFKPDTEFSLMLLQCGQILQDTAAEITKHYFVSDPDPYKFNPGGVLAVHMEVGVPSEDKVLQLAALGLCWLCTGLKIIAQLQSVDESELVAYTTNSKAQGYATGVVNDPPRVISPLAVYSE
ncbi:hypothetical protein BS47DRAFT_1363741 [Hydnum rufescens UP504]|uniref:Uncharacterized protein n=1 Tax=Hydnum rufescens UP504 TaxID=1448309 RepID=A0A9P6DQY8_9AGAM|nr:hypothetical protein BS47DRAFT_1363741 [Hydnum rufescens UP504]